jgi:hypothetical protein
MASQREQIAVPFKYKGAMLSDITWYVDQKFAEVKDIPQFQGRLLVVKGKIITDDDTPNDLGLQYESVVQVVDGGRARVSSTVATPSAEPSGASAATSPVAHASSPSTPADHGDFVTVPFKYKNVIQKDVQWREHQPFGEVKDSPVFKGRALYVAGSRVMDADTPTSLGLSVLSAVILVDDPEALRKASNGPAASTREGSVTGSGTQVFAAPVASPPAPARNTSSNANDSTQPATTSPSSTPVAQPATPQASGESGDSKGWCSIL